MRLYTAFTIFSIAVGAPTAQAHADAIKDAQAAERRDDCPTALAIYRAQAEKGSVQAFSRLGYFSSIGYCVKRDDIEAAKWYEKASAAGDQDAIASLSAIGRHWPLLHRSSPIDPELYVSIERAAKSGSAVAQFSLGVMNYPIGDMLFDPTNSPPSIPGNLSEAISWFQRGADQGDFDSLVTLAYAYSEGLGVRQDYVQAYVLLNVAAPRVKYADMREDIIRRRNELANKMTPAQVADGQRLASEWKPSR